MLLHHFCTFNPSKQVLSMTFFLKSSPALITTAILVFFFSHSYGQEWQTPLIEGYGEIKYFDNTAEQFNLNQEYKLLFDVTSDKQKNGVNKRLWVVARTLNMFHVSGVPSANIKIVVAVHGAATFNILTEEAHINKYGKSNPNIDLIQKLKQMEFRYLFALRQQPLETLKMKRCMLMLFQHFLRLVFWQIIKSKVIT